MNLPDWLKPYETMSETTRLKLFDWSTNWIKLFSVRDKLTEEDLGHLLVIEMEERRRPDIIHRLKYWYNMERHDREMGELWRVK